MNAQDYRRIVTTLEPDDALRRRLKEKVINHKVLRPLFKMQSPLLYAIVPACFVIFVCATIMIQRLSGIASPDLNSNQTVANSKNRSSAATSAAASDGENKGPAFLYPVLLSYGNRIYFGGTGQLAQPGENARQLGTVPCLANRTRAPIFPVRGVSVSQSLCLLWTNTGKNNIYSQFDYLCDETVTVDGKTYTFVPGEPDNVTGEGNYVMPLYSVFSASGSATTGNPEKSLDDAHAYFFRWVVYPKFSLNVIALAHTVIGQIPNGKVYALDEIDPSQAVALNDGKYWFLITKKTGYAGKTVQQVLKEKGLESNVVIK